MWPRLIKMIEDAPGGEVTGAVVGDVVAAAGRGRDGRREDQKFARYSSQNQCSGDGVRSRVELRTSRKSK